MKILLVEDDNSLREIYSVRMRAEGYEVIEADNGEAGLALAVAQLPDLIVSDAMMPKISGFEMLDLLKSNEKTKDIKIIMMTALSAEGQKQRGEKLGADRYLVKSQVGIENLIAVIHEILGDNTQQQNAQIPANPNVVPAQVTYSQQIPGQPMSVPVSTAPANLNSSNQPVIDIPDQIIPIDPAAGIPQQQQPMPQPQQQPVMQPQQMPVQQYAPAPVAPQPQIQQAPVAPIPQPVAPPAQQQQFTGQPNVNPILSQRPTPNLAVPQQQQPMPQPQQQPVMQPQQMPVQQYAPAPVAPQPQIQQAPVAPIPQPTAPPASVAEPAPQFMANQIDQMPEMQPQQVAPTQIPAPASGNSRELMSQDPELNRGQQPAGLGGNRVIQPISQSLNPKIDINNLLANEEVANMGLNPTDIQSTNPMAQNGQLDEVDAISQLDSASAQLPDLSSNNTIKFS